MKNSPDRDQIRSRVFERIARIAHALGSSPRLRLIQILAQSPRTVEELSRESGQTVANTSQHLQRLAKEGLVTVRKQGLSRIYRVRGPQVVGLWENLQDLAHELDPELDRDEALLTDLETKSPASAERVLEEVKDQKAILLDVRTFTEAEASPVQGAVSIPMTELKKELRKLNRKRTVYVFCRGKYCELATTAVRALRSAGFKAYRLRESPFRLNSLLTLASPHSSKGPRSRRS